MTVGLVGSGGALPEAAAHRKGWRFCDIANRLAVRGATRPRLSHGLNRALGRCNPLHIETRQPLEITMHLSTISPTPGNRDAAVLGARWLALESDNTGLVDTDSWSQRGELHQLFEGAVIVSEWDDEGPDFDDIEFDD